MELDLEVDFTEENGFDLEVDFDLDVDFSLDQGLDETQVKPSKNQLARVKRFNRPRMVAYEKAEQMADDIGILAESECVYVLISGNFIAGDLIEAYLVRHNLFAEKLIVATLSLSKENVDSFKNLQVGGYVGNLALLVSDYFFCHERANGIKYIIDQLGGDSFALAAAGVHTKIALIKTACGMSIIIHGSANLRSSGNIEQICFENNSALYDFNENWIMDLVEKYQVKHERLRRGKLWRTLQEHQKKKG